MFLNKNRRAASAALIICAALFASCGAKASNEPYVAQASARIFATGTSTGTYYAFGTALAQTLQNHTDFSYQVRSTGGSQDNVMLIASGDAHLALAQNDVLDYAYNGSEFYNGEPIPGFSAVGACYTEVCQIVARSGLRSIEELAGKTVSVGEAGSGVEINARQILECYGIGLEGVSAVNMSFGDSAKALASGDIDAFFCTAGAPTAAISDLAASKSINLLDIPDEYAVSLIDAHPFFTRYTIPAGTYEGVDYDVAAVAVKATLIVSDSLSQDDVYAITKALFEHSDEIAAAHPKGAELDPLFAVQGVTAPFHPGAQRYYREVGAMQ